jgi:2-amino-4-hydroxy-6-hydroxymethyldihydropteridine diphosphokinase
MTAAPVDAYIGLGSNLDSPVDQVMAAFDELGGLADTELVARSSVFVSAPLGPQDQPDFVNAVAHLRTRLPAPELLQGLQAIETAHARVRARHWGPRTLDLDLLLYGDAMIDTPDLQVPHPQMHLRAFVLVPLHEIDPQLQLPGLGSLRARLAGVDSGGLRRIEVALGD